jgi:hypothetical protein
MLSREEVERRLRDREVLQTAQALYAERDEWKASCAELSQAHGECIQQHLDRDAELDKLCAQRDQLAAEGRVLMTWLTDPPMYPPPFEDMFPLTTAEVERVKRLEAVAEAFAEEWNDSPKCTCHEAYKSRNRDDPDCLYHKSPLLWDALAAWREGEGWCLR